jgi:phage baseplate assembly protein gpV
MPMRKENFRVKWDSAGALTAILATAFLTALLAQADQKKGPTGSVLLPDKGKLNILVDGKSIGHEEFEIAPEGNNWIAKGVTKVSMEGAPAATVTGSLTLQPDGSPVSYEWTAQTDKTNGAHIAFENGVAKMTLQMQGARPFEQDLSFDSPHIAVLDNNLYHQYAVLARVYDWSKRGTQTFSVLIPQELTPGTITVDWVGAVSADGKTYEGLKLITTDIEMVLYLDSNHKLMRLEVPASKAAVVRE